MKIRTAVFVLFFAFALAAVGAAITTTKYVTTNQAAISGKEHRIPMRPAG
jgi:general stress protein CsbA